jgi:hypothetical protein
MLSANGKVSDTTDRSEDRESLLLSISCSLYKNAAAIISAE